MSDEDQEGNRLWEAIIASVRPIKDKSGRSIQPKHVSLKKKLTVLVKKPKHDVNVNYATFKEIKAGDTDAMDKNTAERFRKGEMAIDAVLDMHGLTLEKAQNVLKNFIYTQSRCNKRCLLLITGKGSSRLGKGLIKTELPAWLNHPDIRSLILSFVPAQPKDGGSGAFYVLLKRNRKPDV